MDRLDRSSRDESDTRSSVDALCRELEDRQPLVSLGLTPQLAGAPQKVATLLLAISLDQLLDARELCRRIGV